MLCVAHSSRFETKKCVQLAKECQHLRSSLVASSYLCASVRIHGFDVIFFRFGFLLINQFVHFMLDKFAKLMVVVDDDVTTKPLSFRFPSELQLVPFVPMISIFYAICRLLSHSHVHLIRKIDDFIWCCLVSTLYIELPMGFYTSRKQQLQWFVMATQFIRHCQCDAMTHMVYSIFCTVTLVNLSIKLSSLKANRSMQLF